MAREQCKYDKILIYDIIAIFRPMLLRERMRLIMTEKLMKNN